MLKKTHTIRKQEDIKNVFKLGKTFYTKELLLKVKNNDLGKYRMTVVVSSKVCRKAVDRNRIKRQIKSIFLQEIKKKNANISKDFIFITLFGIKKIERKDIEKKVLYLISLV